MKKMLLVLAVLLAVCGTASAEMTVREVCASTAIAASDAYTTDAMDLVFSDGNMTLSLSVPDAYTGSVTVTYQMADAAAGPWATPEGGAAIFTTKTSGNYREQFAADIGKFIRFIGTEAGGVAPVAMALKLTHGIAR